MRRAVRAPPSLLAPQTHSIRNSLAAAFPVGMPKHLSCAPSTKERSDAACRVVISTHCPSRASPLPPRDERIVGKMRMRHPRKLPPMRWWMYRAARAPSLPFPTCAHDASSSPKTRIAFLSPLPLPFLLKCSGIYRVPLPPKNVATRRAASSSPLYLYPLPISCVATPP